MTDHRPRHARLAAFAGLTALLLMTILPASVARGATTIGLPLRASGLQALTQVTNAATGRTGFSSSRSAASSASTRTVRSRPARSSTAGADRRRVRGAGSSGLVFHPQFEVNRRLYVYYTRTGGDIVVARLRANASGSWTSRSTLEPMLVIEHSAHSNHNGGAMAFGPDGYLYIGTGDGGGGRRPRSQCAEQDQEPARQDPADQPGRQRGRALPTLQHPDDEPVPRARRPAWTRSGRTDCATRGASRSTARRGRCSSPMSARAATRRSTASRRPTTVGGTTAGTLWRASTATTRAAAARPARRCRSPSTGTPAGTARSRVATSIADRRIRASPDCTSSPTSAAVASTRCQPMAPACGCAATPSST
jgi:hypothetical protein